MTPKQFANCLCVFPVLGLGLMLIYLLIVSIAPGADNWFVNGIAKLASILFFVPIIIVIFMFIIVLIFP